MEMMNSFIGILGATLMALVAALGLGGIFAWLGNKASAGEANISPAHRQMDDYDKSVKQFYVQREAKYQAIEAAKPPKPEYTGDSKIFAGFLGIAFLAVFIPLLLSPARADVMRMVLVLGFAIAAIGVTLDHFGNLIDVDKLQENIRPAISLESVLFGFFLTTVVAMAALFTITAPKRSYELPPTPTAVAGSNVSASASANGKVLFTAQGCNACHSLQKGQTVVGPSLYGIYQTAATRKSGVTAHDYLKESIVNPNAFIPDGFQAGLMPQTFGTTLKPEEIEDIIAYFEKELNQK